MLVLLTIIVVDVPSSAYELSHPHLCFVIDGVTVWVDTWSMHGSSMLTSGY